MMTLWLIQPASPEIAGGSPLFDFFKVMFVLAGIVVLAWAGLRVWLPKIGGLRTLRSDLIEVVARQPLEARKTLYVVRAGSRRLLLAASGETVTLLQELPEEAVPDQPAPAAGGFAHRLRKLRAAGQ